jgi:hypothetical protein
LSQSEKLLDKGDFQAAMDLENQYFHVRVHPDHQTYLGFKISNPDSGEIIYFVFCVMIYGCKPATSIVTKLTYPIVKFLHRQGIKFAIFIDDGRTMAATQDLTALHHEIVQETFIKAGWNIQYKKTTKVPVQQLYHQGFICNSEKMEYKLPDFKVDHLKTVLQEIISSVQPIPVKLLARAIGKVLSCERALGPIVRIMLRSSQLVLDHAVRTSCHGWNLTMTVPKTVKDEFQFIMDNIEADNGQPIINHQTGITLNDLLHK